ncbi:hypothetical protein FQN49_005554 [Arthroderma sp. PD_2]|nr:hypothetical protein FQN49_005554 [Arthroderma sp. PD_2]
MNPSPSKPNDGPSRSLGSAILYQDASQDLFIIDIPISISLAQHLPSATTNDTPSNIPLIYSSEAIQSPYSGPSPEPKTESGRAKILKLVPAWEREHHASLLGVVEDGMKRLKEGYQGKWCYPRCTIPLNDGIDASLPPRKRLRLDEPDLTLEQGPKPEPGTISSPNTPKHEGYNPLEAIYGPPPIILAPGVNRFPSVKDTYNTIVTNPNSRQAVIRFAGSPRATATNAEPTPRRQTSLIIPPKSTFISMHIQRYALSLSNPLPLIPSSQKFDFILADPPWPNRSVKRSRHYATATLLFDDLELLVANIVRTFLTSTGVVGVWVTNSGKARLVVRNAFRAAGIVITEEWVWVKTTVAGEAVAALDGVWRKPYEVLIVGRMGGQGGCVRRRIIAGVPDVHSRKPGLRELVGQAVFDGKEYTALEVFARSLTAGWWAIGDEVVRFNWNGWWVGEGCLDNNV